MSTKMSKSLFFLSLTAGLCAASVSVAGTPKTRILSQELESSSNELLDSGWRIELRTRFECQFERDWVWGSFRSSGPCSAWNGVEAEQELVVGPQGRLHLGFVPMFFNKVSDATLQLTTEVHYRSPSGEVALEPDGRGFKLPYGAMIADMLRLLSQGELDYQEPRLWDFRARSKKAEILAPSADPWTKLVIDEVSPQDIIQAGCEELSSSENENWLESDAVVLFNRRIAKNIQRDCPRFPIVRTYCPNLFASALSQGEAEFEQHFRFCINQRQLNSRWYASEVTAFRKTVEERGLPSGDSLSSRAKNISHIIRGLQRKGHGRKASEIYSVLERQFTRSLEQRVSGHLQSKAGVHPLMGFLLDLAQKTKTNTNRLKSAYAREVAGYLNRKMADLSDYTPGRYYTVGRTVDAHSKYLDRRQIKDFNAKLRRAFEGHIEQEMAAPRSASRLAKSLRSLDEDVGFLSRKARARLLRSAFQKKLTKEYFEPELIEALAVHVGQAWMTSTVSRWLSNELTKSIRNEDYAMASLLYQSFEEELSSSAKNQYRRLVKRKGWLVLEPTGPLGRKLGVVPNVGTVSSKVRRIVNRWKNRWATRAFQIMNASGYLDAPGGARYHNATMGTSNIVRIGKPSVLIHRNGRHRFVPVAFDVYVEIENLVTRRRDGLYLQSCIPLYIESTEKEMSDRIREAGGVFFAGVVLEPWVSTIPPQSQHRDERDYLRTLQVVSEMFGRGTDGFLIGQMFQPVGAAGAMRRQGARQRAGDAFGGNYLGTMQKATDDMRALGSIMGSGGDEMLTFCPDWVEILDGGAR
jgi:hypothetical protein